MQHSAQGEHFCIFSPKMGLVFRGEKYLGFREIFSLSYSKHEIQKIWGCTNLWRVSFGLGILKSKMKQNERFNFEKQ